MPDLLGKAQTWLAGVRRQHLATSRALVYVRKDGTEVPLSETTIGFFQEETDANQGRGYVDVEMREYLIPTSELTGPPELGDGMRETAADGTVYEFEARSPTGAPLWRWHDQERTTYRVHMIQVKVTAV